MLQPVFIRVESYFCGAKVELVLLYLCCDHFPIGQRTVCSGSYPSARSFRDQFDRGSGHRVGVFKKHGLFWGDIVNRNSFICWDYCFCSLYRKGNHHWTRHGVNSFRFFLFLSVHYLIFWAQLNWFDFLMYTTVLTLCQKVPPLGFFSLLSERCFSFYQHSSSVEYLFCFSYYSGCVSYNYPCVLSFWRRTIGEKCRRWIGRRFEERNEQAIRCLQFFCREKG